MDNKRKYFWSYDGITLRATSMDDYKMNYDILYDWDICRFYDNDVKLPFQGNISELIEDNTNFKDVNNRLEFAIMNDENEYNGKISLLLGRKDVGKIPDDDVIFDFFVSACDEGYVFWEWFMQYKKRNRWNTSIFMWSASNSGIKMEELSEIFNLSVESIRKIIYSYKNKPWRELFIGLFMASIICVCITS